ncbi:hypothetical protein DITRI_Ditri14bG0100100 [Diplodiscus trichospermus]
MVKCFQFFYILAIFLAFSSGIKVIGRVKGAECEEDMGICDGSCNSKCESSKQKGKGTCETLSSNNNAGRCKCLYECVGTENPSAKRKKCNVGIGPCSAACNDVCCDLNCAAEFAGQDANGVCLEAGSPVYSECVCYFNC